MFFILEKYGTCIHTNFLERIWNTRQTPKFLDSCSGSSVAGVSFWYAIRCRS
jgi:hypothetical protein